MSSTITQSELQTVPKAPINMAIEKPKPELIRTTSIDKIKKFNSFICSQNYYILPSILTWLKTSQTVLKYLILSTVLLKPSDLTAQLIATVKNNYENIQRRLLAIAVYFSVGYIFLQLLVCAYLLCLVFLPAGFVFLMVCLYTVCHLSYRLNSSYVQNEERKMKESASKKVRQSRPKKRDILKGRTISSFNVLG